MVCLRQIFRLFCENVCKVQFSLDNLVKSLQLFPLYYFSKYQPYILSKIVCLRQIFRLFYENVYKCPNGPHKIGTFAKPPYWIKVAFIGLDNY